MTDKAPLTTMRLDKWLWCSRFFKTRALAAGAIKGHKIQVDGEATKPGKSIRAGDKVWIRKPPYQFHITITRLSANRLPVARAALLYREDEGSVRERGVLSAQLRAGQVSFPRSKGRPTKHDRRQIIRFTRIPKQGRNSD